MEVCPESLEAMLECWYIERGLLMNNESAKNTIKTLPRCGLKTKLHENMTVSFYYSFLLQYVSILQFGQKIYWNLSWWDDFIDT